MILFWIASIAHNSISSTSIYKEGKGLKSADSVYITYIEKLGKVLIGEVSNLSAQCADLDVRFLHDKLMLC